MIGIVRGLFGFALAAVALLTMVAPAAAQAPSATVEFTAWSASAFFGAARGDGTLTMADGKKYGISVENIKIGSVGASYVHGTGSGYHLKQAQDMEGRSEERRVGKECRSRWSPYH